MLVDLQAPQLNGLSAIRPNENEITEMYVAWQSYVADTMEALNSLRQNRNTEKCCDEWLFDVKDLDKVKSLITDLQEMSTQIPFKNRTLNMTKDVYIWLSVCPTNNALKRFFK